MISESDGAEPVPMGTTLRPLTRLMAARLVLSLGVFAVALVFVGVGGEDEEGVARGLYGTIAFAFLATGIYAGVFRFIRRIARFGAIQLATDIGIVISLVFFSGGADSIFSFLYHANQLMQVLPCLRHFLAPISTSSALIKVI